MKSPIPFLLPEPQHSAGTLLDQFSYFAISARSAFNLQSLTVFLFNVIVSTFQSSTKGKSPEKIHPFSLRTLPEVTQHFYPSHWPDGGHMVISFKRV